MATEDPKKPTRAELARIFKDPRTLKAVEQLFDLVPQTFNSQESLIEEANTLAGNADAKANNVFNNDRRIKGDRVLLWLSIP